MPLAALVAVLLFSGCSSTPKTPDAKNGEASRVSNADEQVLKQDPIERNYDPHVIMKRAEAFFEKEDYAEAIVEYQHLRLAVFEIELAVIGAVETARDDFADTRAVEAGTIDER